MSGTTKPPSGYKNVVPALCGVGVCVCLPCVFCVCTHSVCMYSFEINTCVCERESGKGVWFQTGSHENYGGD